MRNQCDYRGHEWERRHDSVAPDGLVEFICIHCDEYGIIREFRHVGRPPGRATALGNSVVNKLRAMTENGRRVALEFDECHKMSPDTVRSLKNFFEMSSGGFQKYLGIVLFGWPSFISMLESPEFQEIPESRRSENEHRQNRPRKRVAWRFL